MSYVVDRQEAFLASDVVAILNVRQRRIRSRLLLRDGSLRHTLTRPRTLSRLLRGGGAPIEGLRWPNDKPKPTQ